MAESYEQWRAKRIAVVAESVLTRDLWIQDTHPRVLVSDHESGLNCTSYGAKADMESSRDLQAAIAEKGTPVLTVNSGQYTAYYFNP